MKELLLLRHAKSSWELDVEDRNRPLTKKGIERIQAVSKVSAATFKNCDRIYSSPANRALHTTLILMHTLEIPFHKLIVTEHLYTFDAIAVTAFIRTLDNTLNRVIFVGHNPAFTSVANNLGNISCDNLPTAAWSLLRFNQEDWATIENGVTTYGFPKLILKND